MYFGDEKVHNVYKFGGGKSIHPKDLDVLWTS